MAELSLFDLLLVVSSPAVVGADIGALVGITTPLD